MWRSVTSCMLFIEFNDQAVYTSQQAIPLQQQQSQNDIYNNNSANSKSAAKCSNEDITQVHGNMEIDDEETEGGCCRI